MYYAEVVLNKVLHKEGSGKQINKRGSNTGSSQVEFSVFNLFLHSYSTAR